MGRRRGEEEGGGVESSGGEKRNELDPDRQMDHGHDGCLSGGGDHGGGIGLGRGRGGQDWASHERVGRSQGGGDVGGDGGVRGTFRGQVLKRCGFTGAGLGRGE
jgi:hypothetical protein